jgi:hypothetical protein
MCAATIVAGGAAATPRAGAAQPPAFHALPFAIGERLEFGARAAKVGRIGKATMWVDGPTQVRGTPTWVLHFVFKARVGPVRAEDRTTSWLDPRRMASLQFHKRERHPLSTHEERVEMFPDERRWAGAAGESGSNHTSAPLDELSFMYFIRTLALPADTTYDFDRHFDAARNPTTLRVVRRETITTPAGAFPTVLVEMRVKDPRRYHGEGVIRISLSDDARRLPVRIESRMPMLGRAVLTLESFAPPAARPAVARRQ